MGTRGLRIRGAELRGSSPFYRPLHRELLPEPFARKDLNRYNYPKSSDLNRYKSVITRNIRTVETEMKKVDAVLGGSRRALHWMALLLMVAPLLCGSASPTSTLHVQAESRAAEGITRDRGRLAGMVNGGHISQVEYLVAPATPGAMSGATSGAMPGEPVLQEKIVWLHSGIHLLLRCVQSACVPASF